MSAVGHYLEEEGISTAGISLVREHSEVMRPPRALWVPFMLGRPLGAPNDPAFQREVLRSVLRLFEEPAGPVLRDFPRDAPPSDAAADEDGDACPVNFARPRPAGDGQHALAGALAEEIAQLAPWHDLAVRRRGGTGARLSGLAPEGAGAFVVSFLAASPPANPRPGQSMGESLKLAVDDLRAYYEEAATAQPGHLSAHAIERWFYLQTIAGEVIRAVRRAALDDADASMKFVATMVLVPRASSHWRSGYTRDRVG